MPMMRARIDNFLSQEVKIDEFSHTVLHRNPSLNKAALPPSELGGQAAPPSGPSSAPGPSNGGAAFNNGANLNAYAGRQGPPQPPNGGTVGGVPGAGALAERYAAQRRAGEMDLCNVTHPCVAPPYARTRLRDAPVRWLSVWRQKDGRKQHGGGGRSEGQGGCGGAARQGGTPPRYI
ncbi:hypothetical protein T492DRAFT_836593 [Pavlovales sp. CCMP2436]|nr:hypothetical protein T492DRAFT_836593 [Pavlovales sp. CCMP2436]